MGGQSGRQAGRKEGEGGGGREEAPCLEILLGNFVLGLNTSPYAVWLALDIPWPDCGSDAPPPLTQMSERQNDNDGLLSGLGTILLYGGPIIHNA